MKKTLEVETYYTPDNKPTCAVDVRNKNYCIFLYQTRFGTEDHCFFGKNLPLERDKEGLGFLIPCPECPLHNK
jgi:hypothetical protein